MGRRLRRSEPWGQSEGLNPVEAKVCGLQMTPKGQRKGDEVGDLSFGFGRDGRTL